MSPPDTAAAALAAVAGKGDGRIPYREEVYHPAFDEPLLASGTVEVTEGDRLIRHQIEPVIEIVEIGGTFVSLRDGEDAEVNLVLIPEDVVPVIAAMRVMSSGDATPLGEAFDIGYSVSAEGWAVELVPRDRELALGGISLLGCGTVLRQMTVMGRAGERRVMHFDFPE